MSVKLVNYTVANRLAGLNPHINIKQKQNIYSK